MALKKPSDFFGKIETNDNIAVVEPDISLREELYKVENLSEQISQLQQELTQKVIKNDLESLVLSQINKMQENFENLQKEFSQSNKKDISEFSKRIVELTNIIDDLVESEIPKYKKKITKNELFIDEQINQLQQSVEETITEIREEIHIKFDNIANVVDNNIEHFNHQLQETSFQVKKTENYYKELTEVKADVVINEQHIKKVDKYLQDHYQELLNLKEEVFNELEKLPVGNLQENIERLEKKIDFIKETYSKIEPEVVVKEVIQEGLLTEPPSTDNKDPLTPLDQNFVTLDQLQQHYRLFLNRIQQQLSTIGGGGETQLKYLDDIVGIATNASAYDGKYLKYNHSLGKFEFSPAEVDVDSIILGTDTTGDYVQSISGTENQIVVTGGTGESSTPALSLTPSVSITNSLIVGAGASIAGVVTALSFSGNASSATYASASGLSTSVIGGIGSVTSLTVSGVTTTGLLNVGVGGTIITTTGIGSVGIGSTLPGSTLVVNAPSGYTGNILDLQVGGSSKFRVNNNGALTLSGSNASSTLSVTAFGDLFSSDRGLIFGNSVLISSSGFMVRSSAANFRLSNACDLSWYDSDPATGLGNADVRLFRGSAGTLEQRNAGAAQTFRIYNTYTSATNFERANLGWTNNDFIVGTEKGSSIGTARNLYLQTDGTTRVAITTDGKVGIGTTTPGVGNNPVTFLSGTVLDVRGNIFAKTITLSNASPTQFTQLISPEGNTGLSFYTYGNYVGGFYSVDYPLGIQLRNTAALYWSNSSSPQANGSNCDLFLLRDSGNVLALRNTQTPGIGQTFRVYNTYTSASQYERAYLGWNNNTFQIGVDTAGISTARQMEFQTNGTTRVAITTDGNVGVGTTNPQYKLEVLGSFAATTKSFVIPHPTKQGKKLCYASLEGPENGVYVRGRTQSSVIKLPDYWTGLVDHESITVNLSPIGESALPRVKEVTNNKVFVFTKEEGELDYYYTVYAERKDVDKLEVEI